MVENPDVLEPVRMSAGNDEAEERRLFYVAITRAMRCLHFVVRQGLPSPYIAEIEGTADVSVAADPAAVPVGTRFAGEFCIDRLFPLSEGQAKARIRQVGEFTTATGRIRFTSWLPMNLETGATYSLKGVLKDRPYRDKQRVKLDGRTRVELISRASSETPSNGARALRPRPPPTHRPRLLERSQ